MSDSLLTIDKIGAAERQLNMAIRLFLEGTCPLSVHTLTSAANGILEALYLKDRDNIIRRQIDSGRERVWFSIKEEMQILVKEEGHKDLFKAMNRVANYLKHADKDADQELNSDFSIENRMAIFGACMNFALVAGRSSVAMQFFNQYFLAENPELIRADASEYFKKNVDKMRGLFLEMGKKSFLLTMLRLLKKDDPALFPNEHDYSVR